MVYQWKDTARFSTDAQVIGEELESINVLDPAHIVEYAEDKDTELHKCFTWDDAKAAHLYRLEEARKVVQMIVTVEESDEAPKEYRAFESVIINDHRQYVPTKTALSDKSTREQILGEIGAAIGELSKKADMYRYLAEQEINKAQYHLDLAKEAVTI